MAMTADDYLQHLQALLPQGPAWPRAADADLTKLLRAFADEFERVDFRVDGVFNEFDPRTTSELISDWERVAALPDPCVTSDQSIEQRRAALVSKLIAQGGQSRQYFIDMAGSMGYPAATVDEYSQMVCDEDCDAALWSAPDEFVWQINLPSDGAVFEMDCESSCDDALMIWGDEAIECRINRYKPAHTTVIFAYVATGSGVAWDGGAAVWDGGSAIWGL